MRSWYDGNGFDTGITLDSAVNDYIKDALNGKVTEEAYGAPQGRMTIILPDNADEKPAD